MKKKFLLALFISMFMYSRTAGAIFDIPAAVETFMEIATEVKNKVEEVQKFVEDTQKRLKQGFALATSCFKNPMQCNPQSLVSALTTLDVKTYKETVFAMPNSIMDHAISTPAEDLLKDIEENYVYKAGQGKTAETKNDVENTLKNRERINAIVSNETALLFAKGITTRHSIRKEDDTTMYPNLKDSGSDGNIDKILYAEGLVLLKSSSRIARILELKASMISSEATAELTQQSNVKREE